jgi:hypothetical protein
MVSGWGFVDRCDYDIWYTSPRSTFILVHLFFSTPCFGLSVDELYLDYCTMHTFNRPRVEFLLEERPTRAACSTPIAIAIMNGSTRKTQIYARYTYASLRHESAAVSGVCLLCYTPNSKGNLVLMYIQL